MALREKKLKGQKQTQKINWAVKKSKSVAESSNVSN